MNEKQTWLVREVVEYEVTATADEAFALVNKPPAKYKGKKVLAHQGCLGLSPEVGS